MSDLISKAVKLLQEICENVPCVHCPFFYDGCLAEREINKMPSVSTDKPAVAYVCDGRACDAECSECFRTTNIEHAKHFERIGGAYLEEKSVEHVIKCKDCKFGYKVTPIESGEDILCMYSDWEYFDTDFCSRAERRESDE